MDFPSAWAFVPPNRFRDGEQTSECGVLDQALNHISLSVLAVCKEICNVILKMHNYEAEPLH